MTNNFEVTTDPNAMADFNAKSEAEQRKIVQELAVWLSIGVLAWRGFDDPADALAVAVEADDLPALAVTLDHLCEQFAAAYELHRAETPVH